MANVILIVCVNLFALVMIIVLIKTAYVASFNRPAIMNLAEMNHAKSASNVDLEPFLPIIIAQFPHALDLKSNG
jgi:hypothetical protein